MLPIALFDVLGLSPKAALVYTTLVRLGPSSVRDIANAAGINRGTTFTLLKLLQAQELVSYFHEKTHQYFVAKDPEYLRMMLSNRKLILAETEKSLENVLPQLKSLYDRGGEKPVVKYFEGADGIRTILEDVLVVCGSTAKEYFVYSAAGIREHLYRGYPRFSEERVSRGIQVKVIALGDGGELRGLDERKWIPADLTRPTYSIIYPGRIAMISLGENGMPMGVIVENEGIAETQKAVFLHLWNIIPEKVAVHIGISAQSLEN